MSTVRVRPRTLRSGLWVSSLLFAACSSTASNPDGATTAPDASVADAPGSPDAPASAPGMKLFFNAEIIGPKGPTDSQINVRSATATTDAFHFALDPEKWATSNTLSDPVVYRAKSGQWLIAGFSEKEGIRVGTHQGSPDFTTSTFTIAAQGQVPSFLEFDDGFRLYYFGDTGGVMGILSAFSKDGTTWTQESGVRVTTPAGTNLKLIADPAPARRKDGTIVMYFKASGPPDADPTPYDHMLYRATSKDGLTFTHENKLLVEHASVPQAFTDATGRVGVYYLDFREFPAKREVITGSYEQDDFSLTPPVIVTFDKMPDNTWANDPTPILIP